MIYIKSLYYKIQMIIEGAKAIPMIIESISSVQEILPPTSGAITGISGIPSAQQERKQFED